MDNSFLSNCKGVLHVGGASGRECKMYANYNLNVIFFEAREEAYKNCLKRISNFPKQKAVNALVTDKEDYYNFNISSNRGLSSSIYKLKEHKELWSKVKEVKTIRLKSNTLDNLMQNYDITKYDTIVIDVQGAELNVLKGANKILPFIKYLKIEVANFESYENCCQLKDIEPFMINKGYKEIDRGLMVEKGNKKYWDILYLKEGI